MPDFYVVTLYGKEAQLVQDRYGKPVVYKNADTAQEWANYRTTCTGVKHQIRPVISNDDWRKREKDRFNSGKYTNVPWHAEEWVIKAKECVDHFVHVARKDPCNIAFTSSETKGQCDVKTAMRPSKYLAHYYGKILPETTIREWVANYKKLYDKDNIVQFAYSAKDIVRVYKKGPHSCMKNPPLRSKVHPVSVYEGPDLAVAYLQKQAHIVARSVVWPAKKIYSRIYGDVHLLEELLNDEGFKPGTLEGARLTKIKDGSRYVCPFIDNVRCVKVGRKYLHINKNGKRFAGNQDGYCGQGFRCALCNVEHELHKVAYHQVRNQHYCDPCFINQRDTGKIFQCEITRQWFAANEMVTLHNGAKWHMHHVNGRHAFRCTECQVVYPMFNPRSGGDIPRFHYKQMGLNKHGNHDWMCRDCGQPQKELKFVTLNTQTL